MGYAPWSFSQQEDTAEQTTSTVPQSAATPVVVASEAAPVAPESEQEPTMLESADRLIERSVMPFTNWVEKKIQGSNIIKPSPYQKKNGSTETNVTPRLSLRAAIEQAMSAYPGTVLSSDHLAKPDGQVYRIKILSSEGVIRIIEIPDQILPPDLPDIDSINSSATHP